MPEGDPLAAAFAVSLKVEQQDGESGLMEHAGALHHAQPVGANAVH